MFRTFLVLTVGLAATLAFNVNPDCETVTEVCSRKFEPVCGSDLTTYSNVCYLCKEVKRRHDAGYTGYDRFVYIKRRGQCTRDDLDERFLKLPDNPNEFAQETTKKADCAKYGEHCPRMFRPMCGDDNVTYANECELCLAGTKRGQEILIKRDIAC